jgi:hypothetical protein
MVMHEHPDVIQWGLQIFDSDPINPGYYGEIVHHSADDAYNGHYQEHYDTECSHTDCSHLENDEIIARTLQEDFSQLNVSEASKYSHGGEEHYQASNLEHDWHSPSTMNYYCSGIWLSFCLCFCDSHQLTYISYLYSFYYDMQAIIVVTKKLMMQSLLLHVLALVRERSILILWT